MDTIIHQMVTEIIEKTLLQLKREDSGYCQLLQDRLALDAKVEEVLAVLCDSDQKMYEEYQRVGHEVWGIERITIYMRGFKDSYKLFKWMQM